MSFRDLPADWPRRPLSDSRLAADVLDLCVSDVARRQGGVCVLVLRDDLTLAQPFCVGGPVPRLERRAAVTTLIAGCTRSQTGSAVVFGIVHVDAAVTDDDRALHQDAIEVCRSIGVRLLGAYLVSAEEVLGLPVSREAA
ncbi:MAG: hypothetical protein WA892_13360 [Ornithinimicrobium sp.]